MKTWKDVKAGDTIYYWDKGRLHAQKVYEATVEEKEWKTPIGRNEWHVSEFTVRTIKAGANDRSYSRHPTIMELREWYDNYSVVDYNCLKRFACKEAADAWMQSRYAELDRKRNKLEKKLAQINRLINGITESIYSKR